MGKPTIAEREADFAVRTIASLGRAAPIAALIRQATRRTAERALAAERRRIRRAIKALRAEPGMKYEGTRADALWRLEVLRAVRPAKDRP